GPWSLLHSTYDLLFTRIPSEQLFTCQIATDVLREKPLERGDRVRVRAGGVGGDETPRVPPQWVVVRKRLGIGDIERGARDGAFIKRRDEIISHHQVTASDVDEDGTPLHRGERLGVDHPASGR